MATSESTTERAYRFVRQSLEAGELPPGTRIVTRDVASKIGSSLNPVREALSRLASEGFVEHVPGAGALVRRPDRQEIRELYAIREALESYAAAEAARTIHDSELAELEATCDEWRRFADELEKTGGTLSDQDRPRWVTTNQRFHQILVESARNRLLTKLVSDQRLLAQIFHHHRSHALPIDARVARQVYEGHSELIARLRDRDSDGARNQVANLIRIGCRFLIESLREN